MTAHTCIKAHSPGPIVRTCSSGEECYKKGNESYAKNDVAEAICQWSKAAEVYNHAEACLSLARCYDFGEGTKADQKKAFSLYKRAAKLGSAAGMYNVAACLRLGAGVSKSQKDAHKYFQRAHKHGYVNACVNIGMMYLKGEGVKRNVQKAVKFFQFGVQHDIPAAQYTLGLLYISDDAADLEALLEREREHVTEVEKEKTKSKAKNPKRTSPQNSIPTNKIEGITLLHLAAAAGHAGAAQYLQDVGIPRVNAPKAPQAITSPRLQSGDASNLIAQLSSDSGSVCIQAAKTLSYLIGEYKPNLDVLIEDPQFCNQIIEIIATATSLELLDWMLTIIEEIIKRGEDQFVQNMINSKILTQLIALLEFEEVASRALSVVFLMVNDNSVRKRELRALGMTLQVKDMAAGTCNMVIKHGSFAEEMLQKQKKGRLT